PAIASLVSLLSVQVAWLGISARTLAVMHGFISEDRFITRFYDHFNLELGLVLCAALSLGGSGIIVDVVWTWARQGFPELDAIRPLLLGTTLVIVDVHCAVNAFFLCLLSVGAQARTMLVQSRHG